MQKNEPGFLCMMMMMMMMIASLLQHDDGDIDGVDE
jgi:hypothetical protein